MSISIWDRYWDILRTFFNLGIPSWNMQFVCHRRCFMMNNFYYLCQRIWQSSETAYVLQRDTNNASGWKWMIVLKQVFRSSNKIYLKWTIPFLLVAALYEFMPLLPLKISTATQRFRNFNFADGPRLHNGYLSWRCIRHLWTEPSLSFKFRLVVNVHQPIFLLQFDPGTNR